MSLKVYQNGQSMRVRAALLLSISHAQARQQCTLLHRAVRH